ncbi:MAG: amidohydrolase family protein, partial [Calditrichaeota bacterium]|nr:amidohydrolase family protein [Calditrichota bacterium]
SRDLQRAVTSPWFDDYLHPGLEKFFKPNLDSHGSFFLGWTNTDEVYWRENFQIWFKAVRDFEKMGGIITTGEDGGYIYKLFGFGYLQELLLHEEAGFTPLQVIRHATYNSAKVLGMGDKIGHLKVGYLADLIIVNGNPMADLRALWPRGIKNLTDDRDGGIGWTIKDGIPYHAPTMWKAVRDIVKKSRETNKIGYLID